MLDYHHGVMAMVIYLLKETTFYDQKKLTQIKKAGSVK